MGIPCVCQFLAGANGLQPLINPFGRITFLCVGIQRALDGQLWIDDFLNALTTDHSQPQLKWFCFLGRNGLDDAKKLLGNAVVGMIESVTEENEKE